MSQIFAVELIITGIIGLLLGSFATALIHRVPHKISWVSKRSQCVSCAHILRAWDLLPLFSWCFNRGRCRYCKAQISPSYPLIEIMTACLSIGVYLAFGLTWQGGLVLAIVPLLVAMAVIDIKHMILPNILTLIVFVLGLCYLFVSAYSDETGGRFILPYLLSSVIYATVSFCLGLFVSKLKKMDSLGFGDVKFFACAGLWLGLAALPSFMIVSGVIGVVLGIVWRVVTRSAVFPFGPALIISFYVLLLIKGSQITENWLL